MEAINWHTFFFYLFAAATCAFAVAVVLSSNIVRMAFYLVVSLGATSGLFFLANAPFVGAMQLLIYVGGTLVLLVFGVMLTAQGPFISMKTRAGEWVLAAIVGGGLLSLLVQAAFSVEEWRGQRSPFLAYASGTTRAAAGPEAEVTFRATAPGNERAGARVVLVEAESASPVMADFQQAADPPTLTVQFRPGTTAKELAEKFSHNQFAAQVPDGSRGGGKLTNGDEARLAMRSPRAESDAGLLGLALLGARPESEGQSGKSGYLLPFEIISVHLLVVLVGAAYLARPKRRARVEGD